MKKPTKNTLPIKTFKAIEKNYNLIKNKNYTESDIKELMNDLRIVANMVRAKFKDSHHEEGFEEFIDLCNFIAHPIKQRGVITKKIVNNIELIKTSLVNPSKYIVVENDSLYFDSMEVIDSSDLIVQMFGLIYIALSPKILEDELSSILESETLDITLSILSLLQNSIIELDTKDEDKAVLFLNMNHENLALYCTAYSSAINAQLVASQFNPNADSSLFTFPIIFSRITEIKVNQVDRFSINFFETYRSNQGKLLLRLI